MKLRRYLQHNFLDVWLRKCACGKKDRRVSQYKDKQATDFFRLCLLSVEEGWDVGNDRALQA